MNAIAFLVRSAWLLAVTSGAGGCMAGPSAATADDGPLDPPQHVVAKDPPPHVDAPQSAGDAGQPCHVAAGARVLGGAFALPTRSECTPAAIQETSAACYGPAASVARCSQAKQANPTCAACIFGDSLSAIGAVFDGAIPVVNVDACMAEVMGKPWCTTPLAKYAACVESACATCSTREEHTKCIYSAAHAECLGLRPSEECAAAAKSTSVAVACSGKDFASTFERVAATLCGPPPVLDDGPPAIAH